MIVSWGLCGLLIIYGASLGVVARIPREKQVLRKLNIVHTSMEGRRHSANASIDSQTKLVDVEKNAQQSYTVPAPSAAPIGYRGGPAAFDRREMQQTQQGMPQVPVRMYNPFSMILDRETGAPYIVGGRAAPAPVSAPRPMAPPSRMVQVGPSRLATAPPSVVAPSRVMLSVRMAGPQRMASGQNINPGAPRPTRSAASQRQVNFAVAGGPPAAYYRPPAPVPQAPITDPSERGRMVGAVGGMEWRRLVLDAASSR